MVNVPGDPASSLNGQPGVDFGSSTPGRSFEHLTQAIVASWLVMATMPLWLMIGLAIRLESPGSPIYVDERIGFGARKFRMAKFRTMTHQCEIRSAKISNDDRVTRVGRFLRRSSLDELPQLLNVVDGSMRFVGPRPEILGNLQHYEQGHHLRFRVTPGMTGLWQISGRSNLSLREKLEIDLVYVTRRSAWLDLKIMLRTPLAVVLARGAY